MGKKKPQKTKELSVAIAEASSTGEEAQQQLSQPLPQTPRKRGRPRKIIEGKSSAKIEEAAAAAAAAQEVEASQSKKAKASEKEEEDKLEQEQEEQQKKVKEEGPPSTKPKESAVIRREPSRSRARRKGKPRKSSL